MHDVASLGTSAAKKASLLGKRVVGGGEGGGRGWRRGLGDGAGGGLGVGGSLQDDHTPEHGNMPADRTPQLAITLNAMSAI